MKNTFSKILILCTGNSCRSQIAEGWFRFFCPERKIYSAGTHPEPVNKYAIQVMEEVGIDISTYKSNNVEGYKHIYFDFVITVCDNAKEVCPDFSFSRKKLHYSFDDPAKTEGNDDIQLAVYRRVRDEIKEYIQSFINRELYSKDIQ